MVDKVTNLRIFEDEDENEFIFKDVRRNTSCSHLLLWRC